MKKYRSVTTSIIIISFERSFRWIDNWKAAYPMHTFHLSISIFVTNFSLVKFNDFFLILMAWLKFYTPHHTNYIRIIHKIYWTRQATTKNGMVYLYQGLISGFLNCLWFVKIDWGEITSTNYCAIDQLSTCSKNFCYGLILWIWKHL